MTIIKRNVIVLDAFYLCIIVRFFYDVKMSGVSGG